MRCSRKLRYVASDEQGPKLAELLDYEAFIALPDAARRARYAELVRRARATPDAATQHDEEASPASVVPTEVLLAGVHHVDRFLSAEVVKKEVPERRAREMCPRLMPWCKLR